MKPLIAGSSWVQVEHVVERTIAFNFQYVGMAADKNIGNLLSQNLFDARIILRRSSANMGQPYF